MGHTYRFRHTKKLCVGGKINLSKKEKIVTHYKDKRNDKEDKGKAPNRIRGSQSGDTGFNLSLLSQLM